MCEARKLAFKTGSKRYRGNPCSKCGTTEKYTKLQECVECGRKMTQKLYYDDHEKSKERLRKYNRRLTSVVFEEFFKKQDGVCAVCKQPERITNNGRLKSLALDHCHKTGTNRGLLCQRCNVVLGYVNDDPDILKRMIGYLGENSVNC